MVHRRDRLRAAAILQDALPARCGDEGNVNVRWDSVLAEVLGDESGVTGVTLNNTTGNEISQLDVHGVFIAIGHDPNTAIFNNQLDMDGGYIRVRGGLNGNATETSVPGVFAAGDVMDHVYRQAVTSASSGCMAALDAEKYLAD